MSEEHRRRASWLPPGQSPTTRFPIVGERQSSPELTSTDDWELQVGGLVAIPLRLRFQEFLSLPQCDFSVDIHCVTGWSRAALQFTGVAFREVCALSRPREEARFVRFEAYSSRGHDTTLRLDVARRDVWLAHAAEGKPLTPEHGYPVRSIVTSRYFYKSIKWLHRIDFLEHDRPGFWERHSGYHPDGRFWESERYTEGSMDARQLRLFRESVSFEKYRQRGTVIFGADLRAWTPKSKDLQRVQMKCCDLRDACLDWCDLRGANLTRCDLRGASLTGTLLDGSDVEGADFSGAKLMGVGSSRVDLQACKLEYSIVSPK